MGFNIKIKNSAKHFLILFILLISLQTAFAAREEVINIDKIQAVAVPLHLIELVLAIFISYMALKFFRITKPISIFLVVYVAGGFFIINSMLYLLLYGLNLKSINLSFESVYLGSRISLIAMLVSLGFLFYYLNLQMRKPA